MTYKHRLRKKVFDRNTKSYRFVIVHTNAEYGSGIFDKNGIEIFEGDILRDDEFETDIQEYPVCFWNGSFGNLDPVAASEYLEVIGHVED